MNRHKKATDIRLKREKEQKKLILANIRKKEIQIERRRHLVSLLMEYGIKESKKRIWVALIYVIKVLGRMNDMLEVSDSVLKNS